MPSSFYSALSGMRTHQQWIDVIGNNLANQNTPGYKVSRATFAESFIQTYRQATEPGNGLGGVNPMQIGYGVGLSSIDRTFTQGSLTETGRRAMGVASQQIRNLEAEIIEVIGAEGLETLRKTLRVLIAHTKSKSGSRAKTLMQPE